jgi:hypothetical protein
MTHATRTLAIALAASLLPLTHLSPVAHASGGFNNPQTVALHRQSCSQTNVGAAVGTARFALDDQGGNAGGLEIRTGVTAGAPRTTYAEYILDNACNVLVNAGTLKTDDSGRGDLDVHVAASAFPAGASLRVQLVASADVITSDPAGGS